MNSFEICKIIYFPKIATRKPFFTFADLLTSFSLETATFGNFFAMFQENRLCRLARTAESLKFMTSAPIKFQSKSIFQLIFNCCLNLMLMLSWNELHLSVLFADPMLAKTVNASHEQSKYVCFNADTFHDHQCLQCNVMTSLLIIPLMNDRISSKSIEARRLIKYLW